MGTTRHFHVVFDVRVLDLNLSNCQSRDVTEAPMLYLWDLKYHDVRVMTYDSRTRREKTR